MPAFRSTKRHAMAVACGAFHTVMVAEEGRAVLACGNGGDGQLGNGSYEHQRVPGAVSGLAEVLEGAREDMAAVFGYAADSQKVGITGTVELVEIEGPIVIIRLGGRFWHKRSDVVQRVANYLIERIPEICDVEVEDAAQLDDADKLEAKPGW